MNRNYVALEGVVKKIGVRRGFFGELTTLFVQTSTSRGKVHVLALARLPEEARERIQEGMAVSIEGELDYEKKKSGGFEVFVFAKKVKALESATQKEVEDYAEFDF